MNEKELANRIISAVERRKYADVANLIKEVVQLARSECEKEKTRMSNLARHNNYFTLEQERNRIREDVEKKLLSQTKPGVFSKGYEQAMLDVLTVLKDRKSVKTDTEEGT